MGFISWLKQATGHLRGAYQSVAKPLMRGAHWLKNSAYGNLRYLAEEVPYIGTAAKVANTVIDKLAEGHDYVQSDEGNKKMADWNLEDRQAARPDRPYMDPLD